MPHISRTGNARRRHNAVIDARGLAPSVTAYRRQLAAADREQAAADVELARVGRVIERVRRELAA